MLQQVEDGAPVLESYGIAVVSPFSHRLAFDNMHIEIQRLRCKVNFEALVFVPHVRSIGEALVSPLRYSIVDSVDAVGTKYLRQVIDTNEDHACNGQFFFLHLRFDKLPRESRMALLLLLLTKRERIKLSRDRIFRNGLVKESQVVKSWLILCWGGQRHLNLALTTFSPRRI
ncbi:hypothetical protein Tco_0417858 [Tanacetum coccineum]